MMNSLESLNQQGFLLLNAVPGTSAGWVAFATFCAQYTLPVIPLILLGHWFLGGKTGHRLVLSTLVTILVAMGLGFICSMLWPHPRPFMISLGHTWIYHAADNSFPSDHGTLFFSAGLSLLLSGAKRSGIFILILAGFVAWSRAFLGVHFPLDMVGAALMALLACVVVRPLWDRWGDALTALCESLSIRLFSWLPARLTP